MRAHLVRQHDDRTPTGSRSTSFSTRGILGPGAWPIFMRWSRRLVERVSVAASLVGDPIGGWRFEPGCLIGRLVPPGRLAPLPCRYCCATRLGDPAAGCSTRFGHPIANARFERSIGRSRRESGRCPCRASSPGTSSICSPIRTLSRRSKTPQWQTLPAETRRTLMKLMIRLILDHANGDLARERQEARHDV